MSIVLLAGGSGGAPPTNDRALWVSACAVQTPEDIDNWVEVSWVALDVPTIAVIPLLVVSD